jgi:hypothetical protein
MMHDLAELFGTETNAEALKRLEDALRASKSRRRVDVDVEADYVFVYAGREAIVDVAVLIHAIAGRALATAEVAAVRDTVRKYERPEARAWSVGSVFAVPLGDGSCAFGQVIFEEAFAAGSGVRAPTCALFDHRGPDSKIDVEEILTSRTLAVLKELSTELDSGSWRVVGQHPPVASHALAGPTSGSQLEPLARAWHGIDPWNVLHDERHWDRRLLRGIERPADANVLSSDARRAYRRQVFGLDE